MQDPSAATDYAHLHAGDEYSPASDWRIWHGIDPPQRGSKEQQEKQASIYGCGAKYAESLHSHPPNAIERASCLIACSPHVDLRDVGQNVLSLPIYLAVESVVLREAVPIGDL